MYILSHLESHLALPATTLTKLHDQQQPSGDHVRFIKSPPIPFPKPPSKSPSMGAHTDFGSVTILMNRLGGLQILPPTTMMEELGQGHLTKPEWVYVKPLPGHAVVNMGDAMVKFSSGLLRSNIHRVVTPPPPQDSSTRYSLVYFCRPCDDVPLVTIREGKIKEHLVKTGRDEVEEEVTAKDWIRDKAMSKRLGVPGGYRGKESFDPRRETAGEVLGEVVKAH
jgi:isopenicillin N synthase-like dioxygenase